MADDMTKARFLDAMESLQSSVKSMMDAQRKQAQMTGTATAAGKRVTVVVNARGVVIQTRFSPEVRDLTYEEIAAAVTTAAQDAAAQVERKTREIIASLQESDARLRLPKFSDIVPGMPEPEDLLPEPPEVSLAPPGARSRRDSTEDTSMEFDRVEQRAEPKRSGVAETGW
ncbi:YbaB/EbfC family nucleoid-associated protein [Nocardia sp. NPDC052566]|uniref:YbaB/EbfC family nucleoid-associated protein n=1 Tax=Nocardia sp. NPDC052566 TaxID=3364330 RepID=UPI0037CC9F2F